MHGDRRSVVSGISTTWPGCPLEWLTWILRGWPVCAILSYNTRHGSSLINEESCAWELHALSTTHCLTSRAVIIPASYAWCEASHPEAALHSDFLPE
ncbi:hypothetical protein E2C01_034964 [Portunus trituberculatus]|uniref:Uncharacterized protein n=1 Tax=Portunus trituberculatus TaxID=210409 RepID=A0A5B7F6Z4_PORTR|nr:hypothetical protein [Portunus trituberculatus]